MTAPAKDDDVREEVIAKIIASWKEWDTTNAAVREGAAELADALLSQFEIHKRPEVISK